MRVAPILILHSILSAGMILWVSGCVSALKEPPAAVQAELKDQKIETRLRAGIHERLKAGLGWGYVAAIREDGKNAVFAAGKKTLEPASLFLDVDSVPVGSVSKVFTGFLLHLAEQEGRLKLNKTLGEVFPRLKKTDAGKITLFDLGLHQSGLPRSLPSLRLKKDDPYADIQKEEVLRLLGEWKAPNIPGLKAPRVYSNWGYLVLGLVLEKVYGQSYSAILQNKIFSPLGFENASIHSESTKTRRRSRSHRSRVARASEGYSLAGDPLPEWSFKGFTAATGGVQASAADIQLILAALESPGESTLGKAIRLSMDSGIGWDSEPGHSLLWKSGATAGTRSILLFDRSKKRGLFLETNAPLATDSLAIYAAGLSAADTLVARIVTPRLATADEIAHLKGRYHVVSPSPALTGLVISETLGRIVGHYSFGSATAGVLLLPGAEFGSWNVAEGELNIDKIRVSSPGDVTHLSLSISTGGLVTVYELEKEPVKVEAYPAQE
ncbi:MAG: beta-lactamase family protein [Cryobacterium sp.]|nr:beta-lactamase family protein [Oligoflexia bacterium]